MGCHRDPAERLAERAWSVKLTGTTGRPAMDEASPDFGRDPTEPHLDLRMIDRTGKRYGRWTALSPAGYKTRSTLVWLCECDCGRRQKVSVGNLVGRLSTQCRVCGQEQMTRKARQKGRQYQAKLPSGYHDWLRIRQRHDCVRRWSSLANFLADMGPSPPHARLRKRARGHKYGPKNSYWEIPVASLPRSLQRRLKSTATRNDAVREAVTDYGVCRTDLCRILGISRQRLLQILNADAR